MYSALKHFGFPETLINLVKVLYENISLCVTNNGHFSEFFNLSRGVRQGCPLSPYLFVLSVEVLSLYLKQKSEIQGVVVNGVNYLISQFADDTSLAILNEPINIERCFEALNKFAVISGLKINVNKTEVLQLGCSRKLNCGKLKLNWVEHSTRILGIHICNTRQGLLEVNYKEILNKLKNKLSVWNMRNLSLLGKITIIKVLGISQLVYLFGMLPSPPITFFNELDHVLFKFLWNNSNDRIKRKTIIGPLDMGGLNMVDSKLFNSAIKIGWIPRLIQNRGKWSNYILEKCPLPNNVEDIKYVLGSNTCIKDIHELIPINKNNVWYEILDKWANFNYLQSERIREKADILEQHIWFNSCIRKGGKTIVNKNLYHKGVKNIKDLLNNDKWYSLDEFNLKYDCNLNFLDYMSILQAIPKQWRKTIQEDVDYIKVTTPNTLETLLNCKHPVKWLYKVLISKNCILPDGRLDSWNQKLNVRIHEFDWLDNLEKYYYLTICSKLRSFNYRFNLRDVMTNDRLKKMGIAQTDLCYLCNKDVESIEHLYWYCGINKKLWEGLRSLIKNRINYILPIDPVTTLLGLDAEGTTEEIPNIVHMLMLITKYYIHNMKCHNACTNIRGLLCKINEVENIERNIAKSKGIKALCTHKNKWENLCNIIYTDSLPQR